MIAEYFDLAVTFLHASIQIAIGLFIVLLAFVFLVNTIAFAIKLTREYKEKQKRLEFLEAEVKRLKIENFQMGFTDYAPIWLTVEEAKEAIGDYIDVVAEVTRQRNKPEIKIKHPKSIRLLMEKIEQVEKKDGQTL